MRTVARSLRRCAPTQEDLCKGRTAMLGKQQDNARQTTTLVGLSCYTSSPMVKGLGTQMPACMHARVVCACMVIENGISTATSTQRLERPLVNENSQNSHLTPPPLFHQVRGAGAHLVRPCAVARRRAPARRRCKVSTGTLRNFWQPPPAAPRPGADAKQKKKYKKSPNTYPTKVVREA